MAAKAFFQRPDAHTGDLRQVGNGQRCVGICADVIYHPLHMTRPGGFGAARQEIGVGVRLKQQQRPQEVVLHRRHRGRELEPAGAVLVDIPGKVEYGLAPWTRKPRVLRQRGIE
ncbi:hypothetical protein D3C72_2007870 [compost metagenome]